MSKQKVELYANTSQVMNDAVDRIVVDIYNKKVEKEKAQKIVMTGCGTHCGNTSTCIGLSISFAAAKWKTLIVDCDIRKANDYKKLNQNTNIGLADFLIEENAEEKVKVEDIIYPTNFDSLSYIPCGKYTSNPARLFGSNKMNDFLQYIDEHYDYVVFDFPSIAVAPDAQLLFGKVDGIILVSALNEVTKKQIADAKHKVAPFADRYYGMIINKINPGLYKKYVKNYDYYFLDKNGKQKFGRKKVEKM